MGQRLGVGAPLDLTTKLESILWGGVVLLGSGWRIGVGVGGGSGAEGKERTCLSKELHGNASNLTSALPLQHSEAFTLGVLFGLSPGLWYCPGLAMQYPIQLK